MELSLKVPDHVTKIFLSIVDDEVTKWFRDYSTGQPRFG
jgi:hypothetical protein